MMQEGRRKLSPAFSATRAAVVGRDMSTRSIARSKRRLKSAKRVYQQCGSYSGEKGAGMASPPSRA